MAGTAVFIARISLFYGPLAGVVGYCASRGGLCARVGATFASCHARRGACHALCQSHAASVQASAAANIAALTDAWSTAYSPVLSPATKTSQTVAAKDTARIIVTSHIRTYAQFIANSPGVGSDMKKALGLNPRTSPPRPITAPLTFPVLAVQSGSPLAAILRYRDSANGVSGKAKPYGVTQCQIFGAVSATPSADRAALPLFATVTKSPFTLNFTAAQGGQQFYCAARWMTRTALAGPWSQVVNFTVMT